MATLRVPPSLTLSRSPHAFAAAAANKSCSSGGRSGKTSAFRVVRSSLRQQEKKRGKDGGASASSPLRFDLEDTIAELERLFRQTGVPGGDGTENPGGRPVRVAYQGARGSYCQEAAARVFPSSACEAFPCGQSMEEAFAALEDRSAYRAVVPAENSLDGPIDRNLDLLLRHPGVRIVGELVLPVRHCLLSLPSARPSALRRVVSHPQALAHCCATLGGLGLDVEEVPCAAEAARLVAEDRLADTAVVGSGIAAREFGLRVLHRDLQDPVAAGNYNRFLQLGLGPAPASATGCGLARKTTVAFSLGKGVSELHRAMWAFESRGVRVTRVDHRPDRSNPVRVVPIDRDGAGEVATYFNYVFVVDVEGSDWDPRVKLALERLREIAGFVRVLGSYTCAIA